MRKNYRGNKGYVVRYGKYTPTEDEHKAYRWCIANGIIIWPESKMADEWRIEIKLNKKKYYSPQAYKKIEVWEKMFEYYEYYYNKYEKKI